MLISLLENMNKTGHFKPLLYSFLDTLVLTDDFPTLSSCSMVNIELLICMTDSGQIVPW